MRLYLCLDKSMTNQIELKAQARSPVIEALDVELQKIGTWKNCF